MADPGQDPRGAPDLDCSGHMLDTTPEGRGTNWYPKLNIECVKAEHPHKLPEVNLREHFANSRCPTMACV